MRGLVSKHLHLEKLKFSDSKVDIVGILGADALEHSRIATDYYLPIVEVRLTYL